VELSAKRGDGRIYVRWYSVAEFVAYTYSLLSRSVALNLPRMSISIPIAGPAYVIYSSEHLAEAGKRTGRGGGPFTNSLFKYADSRGASVVVYVVEFSGVEFATRTSRRIAERSAKA